MKNNYIISLTTIPSKFDNLYLTIDSIIKQTILPIKIIINIPKIYHFRMNNSAIPVDKLNYFINKYSKFNVFINLLNEDYGPGTKLLGLFNNNIIDNFYIPNTYIVLVDDDLIYKPYMLEYFDNYIKTNNNKVFSYCVYNYCNIKIGQGADGFFIKSDILDKFLNYFNVIKNYDYIKYHDDYYISYYLYLRNIHVEYIKAPNNCLIYDIHGETYTDALCMLDGKYEKNQLHIKINELLNEINKNGCFNFLQNNI